MSLSGSPFEGKLHTNYSATDDERISILQLCDGRKQDIERLNEQIKILTAQRDELQAFVDGHHALLMPIRRLSPEVLQQIFVQCLPQDRNPAMSASEAPTLSLGRVCSA